MSNSFDPDQARFVGPDLSPNCLPRLSADDAGRQKVKHLVQLFMLNLTEHKIKTAHEYQNCQNQWNFQV